MSNLHAHSPAVPAPALLPQIIATAQPGWSLDCLPGCVFVGEDHEQCAWPHPDCDGDGCTACDGGLVSELAS